MAGSVKKSSAGEKASGIAVGEPFVSIIVPFKSDYQWVRECVRGCKSLDYKNFEIILLPDGSEDPKKFPGCKIVPTGVVNHAAKRNAGMRTAKSDIFAFIDSDAYPRSDWLKNGVRYLQDKSIGIIGGPNLTPPADSLMQKVSGDVLGSVIGAGGMAERYSVRRERDTDALPSVNMLIRREAFDNLGHGWDETLVTGEDVKMCYQIADLGLRIHYSPEVVVYHHRRAMFAAHMEQIWNYARDEGLLVRQRRAIDRVLVLAPSAFVLWAAFGAATAMLTNFPLFEIAYYATLGIYAATIAVASIAASPARAPLVFLGMIATHATYGIGFLRGLLLPRKYFTESFKRHTYNR